MLLTSAGIRNDTLKSELVRLNGKRFAATRLVFLPTASVADGGDHGWLVEDLNRVYQLGWREFDVLALNGLPAPAVLERLRHADVIYACGGNHYHLARSLAADGLGAHLPGLLDSKVWVGMSAGSMVFSRGFSRAAAEAFGEDDDLRILDGAEPRSPAGLFDWYLKPHLNSPGFPNRNRAWFERAAARLDFPVYALDDESAVRVRGEAVDVVSEGRWHLFNGPDGEEGPPPPDRPADPARRRLLRLPGTGVAGRSGRR
jgi:dipeptidase E